MRRLTAGKLLAVAAGVELTGTCSFAFVAPAHPTPPLRKPARIVHDERPVQQQRRARQGAGGEDEAYREDDQRRFWDTVVEVCVRACVRVFRAREINSYRIVVSEVCPTRRLRDVSLFLYKQP